MKCGLCRESGHNQKTCPKRPSQSSPARLPRATPDELMRMLIDPMQALMLVTQGKAGEALANATRRINELNRDDLGHLVCSDILIALAELELRGRQISAEMLESVESTREAIDSAKAALAAAEHAHARSKAEVLIAIGYREKAEELGFRVGIVEAEASA